MAFLKKIWKDRVTEYPTRRTLKKSDGSTEIVTVERAEGQVSVEGDPFSAATMNDLEDRVADEFESLNSKLENRGSLGIIIRENTDGWNNENIGSANISDFSWIHIGNYDATYPDTFFNLCSVPIPVFKNIFTTPKSYVGNNENNLAYNYAYYIDEHTLGVYKSGRETVVMLTK